MKSYYFLGRALRYYFVQNVKLEVLYTWTLEYVIKLEVKNRVRNVIDRVCFWFYEFVRKLQIRDRNRIIICSKRDLNQRDMSALGMRLNPDRFWF